MDAPPSSSRPAAVAGMFYPADASALRTMVQQCLDDAAPRLAGSAPRPKAVPKAVIVPHAGLVYSGPTAALAYGLVARQADQAEGEIERVVLLGPCHRVYTEGIAESGADAFETPLGPVPVLQLADEQRRRLPQLQVHPATHADEHSLEVQLPFLQIVLPGVPVLPLVVGGASPEQTADLLDELWGGPETLIVVSSDLSHYLTQAQAEAADAVTLRQVLDLDGPLASRQACGAAPVNGLLVAAARHGLTPTLLGHCTSGDPNLFRTSVDTRRVVGYAAVSFA